MLALVVLQLPAYSPGISPRVSVARTVSPLASLQRITRAEALKSSAAALFSLAASPAMARELTPNEQREQLQALIAKRGGLDPERRGNFNEKALFSEDFYFKYGLRPSPDEVREKLKDQELPFAPVQRRYTGYQKYAPRIKDGVEAYTGTLRAAISDESWPAVLAELEKGSKGQGDAVKAVSPSASRSAGRAYGLFANTVLQSENDSATTTANLLARHLINEYYFCLDDIATAATKKDAAAAKDAWRVGKEYINAYLALVNQAIPSKVGDKFPLVDASV